VAGSVKDKVSGQTVDAVAISVDDQVIGYSDVKGQFDAKNVTVRDGSLIRFRRVGLEPLQFELWPADSETEVNLAIALNPAPVRLGEVVVEADKATVLYPLLGEFDQHRKAGFGTLLTPQQIAQIHTFKALQVLEWTGAILHGDSVELPGLGYLGRECHGPIYFINGRRYGIESAMMVLDMIPPEDVLAVEVYKHQASMPIEYNVTGSACGVVAYWLKR
jgi:hypothetical protein